MNTISRKEVEALAKVAQEAADLLVDSLMAQYQQSSLGFKPFAEEHNVDWQWLRRQFKKRGVATSKHHGTHPGQMIRQRDLDELQDLFRRFILFVVDTEGEQMIEGYLVEPEKITHEEWDRIRSIAGHPSLGNPNA